jgi:hypothetical protein
MSEHRARASARRLFAATGWPVEKRLAAIERDAKNLLTFDKLEADDRRWAIRALRTCSIVFAEPPPASLVELVERIAKVPAIARSRIRRKDKWLAAAKHKASHPEATARQIATAIDYQQWPTITRWMSDPDWQDEVASWGGN